LQTTRDAGNLATHVGDDPKLVALHRKNLSQLGVPSEPCWLNQVHSSTVHDFDRGQGLPQADGAVTGRSGVVLAILTADCLPLLAFSRETDRVGAFHAGWKGLVAGIVENGVTALGGSAEEQDWWIGPGIGPDAYTVGPEVRSAFLATDPEHEDDFYPSLKQPDRWQFDLASAAERRLKRAGVEIICRAPWRTDQNPELFWSYRRDPACGRTATLIWKETP
jgi:YfiH family protein